MTNNIDVLISFKLQDGDLKKATASIEKFGKSAESSTRGVDRAEKSMGGLNGAVGKLAAGGVLAGAGAALLQFGRDAITAASDVEEMQSKFNIVFSETGDQVTSSLQNFADAAGRSIFELQGMASTFGDTLKPMGFTEQAAADMSVTLSQLATDLGSFNNMSTDEALQRLQGTLIGSHENALAFGVIINEGTLAQELMRIGADKLTGAQLEQAKVQARINLLMKGTTDAQGDAIRTADGYANKQRALQAATEQLSVTVGQALLPVMTELVGVATEVTGQLGTAAGSLGEYSNTIQGIVQGNIDAAESMADLVAEGQRVSEVYENTGALGRLATGTNKGFTDSQIAIAMEMAKTADSFEEYETAVHNAFGGQVEFANILNRSSEYAGETAYTMYELAKAEQEVVMATNRAVTEYSQWEGRIQSSAQLAQIEADALRESRLEKLRGIEASHNYADAIYEDVEAAQAHVDATAEMTAALAEQRVAAFQAAEGLAAGLLAAQEAGDPTAIVEAQSAIQASYQQTAFDALLAGAETSAAFEQALEAGVAMGAITQEQADLQASIGGTNLKISELNSMLQGGSVSVGEYAAAFQSLGANATTSLDQAVKLAQEASGLTETLTNQGASGLGNYYQSLSSSGTGEGEADITPQVDLEPATMALTELSGQLEAYKAEIYEATVSAETDGAQAAVSTLGGLAEQVAGEYNISFNISQTGSVPSTAGFASGGLVGGTPISGVPGRDNVYAALRIGEYVVRDTSVNSQTRQALEFINRYGRLPYAGGYADGGQVSAAPTPAASGVGGVNVSPNIAVSVMSLDEVGQVVKQMVDDEVVGSARRAGYRA